MKRGMLTDKPQLSEALASVRDVSFHLLSTKVVGPGHRPLIAVLVFNRMFFLIVLNFSQGSFGQNEVTGEITAIFTHKSF